MEDTINDADDELAGESQNKVKGKLAVENKGRGLAKEYQEIETFNDYSSAREYMNNEMSSYYFKYSKDTSSGRKAYYNCKKYIKCRKTMYINLHNDSSECTIFRCIEDHNHEENKYHIPQKLKDLVENCLKDGINSNKRILKKCRENNFSQVSVMQLNNLKARLRTKGDKLPKVFTKTKSQQKKWCVPSCDRIKEVTVDASSKLNTVVYNDKFWNLSKCTCLKWCKEYKCKHMLELAAQKMCFDYPLQAKDISVGCNRRRGRPRLTASASEHQVDECVLSNTSNSEVEEEKPRKKGNISKPSKCDSDSNNIFESCIGEVSTKSAPVKSKVVIEKNKVQAVKTVKRLTRSAKSNQ